MTRPFTGRHMAAIIVGFFGVVIVVNIIMATLAVRTFGGTVVDDSYSAGQKFNDWLDDARRQKERGWGADITRTDSGHLRVALDVPEGLAATLRLNGSAIRPLGQHPETPLTFAPDAGGFVTTQPLPPGRWIVRLTVSDGDKLLARFEQETQP